jgi:hypothetical protein
MNVVTPRTSRPTDCNSQFVTAISAARTISGYARAATKQAADPRYQIQQARHFRAEAAECEATAVRFEAEAVGWASR